MERKTITIKNSLQQEQEFVIDAYDDHIELHRLSSDTIEDVSVPEEIEGAPVTVIGDGCFSNRDSIKSISLPNTVTRIGEQAFAMCKGIGELILPDSITEIERYAFRDCTGLRRIVLPANLKTLRSGVFAFCYLPDDVEIILNEGLETIEWGVFSSGGLNHFFKIRLPNSVKEVADGAFDPGVTIETCFPYDNRWFVSPGTACIKEMFSEQDLENNIIQVYDAMSNAMALYKMRMMTKDGLLMEFSKELDKGFYKFLSERGIRFVFSQDNWISFMDDYKLWLQGYDPKSRNEHPWLFLSRTKEEVAIWEQTNHDEQPEWAKYYVELSPKDKASFFKLMNVFNLPADYFEPAADDVVFDERKPAGHTSGTYGGGNPFAIFSNWSDADSLLRDSSPIGKTFSFISDLGLKATVVVTEQTDWNGDPVFIGEGTIDGYTTDRTRQVEICVKTGSIYSINYLEYPEDADYYDKFPLWKNLIQYGEHKQRIMEKALDNSIFRFHCSCKAHQEEE